MAIVAPVHHWSHADAPIYVIHPTQIVEIAESRSDRALMSRVAVQNRADAAGFDHHPAKPIEYGMLAKLLAPDTARSGIAAMS
jgi:hypothetical protein